MVHYRGKIHLIAGIATGLLAAGTTLTATASNGLTGPERVYVLVAGLLAGAAALIIGRAAISGL